MVRIDGRGPDALRPVSFEPSCSAYAEGSCMIRVGQTHVLCTASIEERVPFFLKGQRKGWITAEYSMLPRATHSRSDRESVRGKQSGRTHEIQRLIGRTLRSVVNEKALGERTIKIDCDVLQADGGTRTASITGAYVALFGACAWLTNKKILTHFPLMDRLAATSCGLISGSPVLDLTYAEDAAADTDANIVMTGKGSFTEIQASAEGRPFKPAAFQKLLATAQTGLTELLKQQKEALKKLDPKETFLAKLSS